LYVLNAKSRQKATKNPIRVGRADTQVRPYTSFGFGRFGTEDRDKQAETAVKGVPRRSPGRKNKS